MRFEGMQKVIYKLYHIFWAIFVILFLVLFVFFDLNIKGNDVKEGYEILTDYEVEIKQDQSEPKNVTQIYTFTLNGVEETYNQLVFYSIHQNVRIFLDDVCIYRMSADKTEMSGNSPGCVWNQVSFSKEDNGKQVCVEIVPVYKSSIDIVPQFYFGNKSDVMETVILRSLPTIYLSIMVIVVGIIYVIFILSNYKKTDVENNLRMLGYFAIQLGLWKLTDTEAVHMVFAGYPVFSQVPFMALMLMCVSFIGFIRDLYSTREHWIWDVLCIMGLGNIGFTLWFQYMGIADMRQMLPVIHFLMILAFVIITIMTIYEIRSVGWNEKLKRNTFCTGICLIGAGLDMVIYYLSDNQISTILGMIAFTVYIFVMGLASMKDIKALMDIGVQAKKYEKMAYHDHLTGLYNRTAFAEHTGSDDFVLEKCIIIVMDLNNLKFCNDKLGHDKGDIYIKECARMIKECFGEMGRCYRMGGDEFYVLLPNGDLHLCKQRLQALKDKVAKCDKVGNGFHMGIACGYKMFDRLLDYDINETARRADKEMYQQKFAMKEL